MEKFNTDDLHIKALCHRDQLNWFNALFNAIANDLENNRNHNASHLVNMGKYLSEDLGHYAQLELDEVENVREVQA